MVKTFNGRDFVWFLSRLIACIIAILFVLYTYDKIKILQSTNLSLNPTSITNIEALLPYLPPGSKYRLYPSPPNLPSVLLSDKEEKDFAKQRAFYGGKKDKPHLGGFTEYDASGISHNAFNFMMGGLAIKSLVDVGCGKGVSTKYFYDHGIKVLCVEGSHDAVLQSLLPSDRVVEHDFTRGPWWPAETYDAAWSVEFLEHVGRQYMENYLSIFHKCALIFVTASGWGGWHHVEIHGPWWWRSRFATEGFIFSIELTAKIREIAILGREFTKPKSDIDAQHIIESMQVYINPQVASLPRHRHLIGGHGCYDETIENQKNGLPCTVVADLLPPFYQSIQDCRSPDKKQWICTKNDNATKQI